MLGTPRAQGGLRARGCCIWPTVPRAIAVVMDYVVKAPHTQLVLRACLCCSSLAASATGPPTP
eukprot:3153327-Alexandrium_andersonii.AAC.1